MKLFWSYLQALRSYYCWEHRLVHSSCWYIKNRKQSKKKNEKSVQTFQSEKSEIGLVYVLRTVPRLVDMNDTFEISWRQNKPFWSDDNSPIKLSKNSIPWNIPVAIKCGYWHVFPFNSSLKFTCVFWRRRSFSCFRTLIAVKFWSKKRSLMRLIYKS